MYLTRCKLELSLGTNLASQPPNSSFPKVANIPSYQQNTVSIVLLV